MNLVNLENVVKGYGQRVLLDGVSAGVAAGESTGCSPGPSAPTRAGSPGPGTCAPGTSPRPTG